LIQKEATLREVWNMEEGGQGWSLNWRRCFQWELELVEQLQQFLFIVILTAEEDYWGWIPTGEGPFTVKSAYTLLAMDLVR
jgi:hypothetical protein